MKTDCDKARQELKYPGGGGIGKVAEAMKGSVLNGTPSRKRRRLQIKDGYPTAGVRTERSRPLTLTTN